MRERRKDIQWTSIKVRPATLDRIHSLKLKDWEHLDDVVERALVSLEKENERKKEGGVD